MVSVQRLNEFRFHDTTLQNECQARASLRESSDEGRGRPTRKHARDAKGTWSYQPGPFFHVISNRPTLNT
jgi:hypothetical protein